jgi:hypothetical protein
MHIGAADDRQGVQLGRAHSLQCKMKQLVHLDVRKIAFKLPLRCRHLQV